MKTKTKGLIALIVVIVAAIYYTGNQHSLYRDVGSSIISNRNSFNCETLFLWIQKSCENSYQRFEREQNTPGRRDTFACAWCSLFHWKYFIFPDC